MAGPRRHRSSPEAAGHHTAHGRLWCRAVRPLERPWGSPAMYPHRSGHHRASPAVHSPGSTTGPYGAAECTACRLTMSMGWAGPNPSPSFTLIDTSTTIRTSSRRSAADQTWMVDRRDLAKLMAGASRSMFRTTLCAVAWSDSAVDSHESARSATMCIRAEGTVGRSRSAAAQGGRQRPSQALSAWWGRVRYRI